MSSRFPFQGTGIPTPSMRWDPMNIQSGVTSELLRRGLTPIEMRLAAQTFKPIEKKKQEPGTPAPPSKDRKPA